MPPKKRPNLTRPKGFTRKQPLPASRKEDELSVEDCATTSTTSIEPERDNSVLAQPTQVDCATTSTEPERDNSDFAQPAHVECGSTELIVEIENPVQDQSHGSDSHVPSITPIAHSLDNSECMSIESEVNVSFSTTPGGLASSPASGCNLAELILPGSTSPGFPAEPVSSELLKEACMKIQAFLPDTWMTRVHEGGIDVMLLSQKGEAAVQRRLHFTPNGKVSLSVHCQPVNAADFLKNGTNSATLMENSLNVFVDRCVKIVEEIRAYEVCAGLDDPEYKEVWSAIPTAKIDCNPYQESRYKETLRSNKCCRLVVVRRWRCKECQMMRNNVHRKAELSCKEDIHPATRNDALSDSQKIRKLEEQHKKLRALNQKLRRREEKIEKLLEAEGVNLSEDISGDLMNILKETDLSPEQALFLQQQSKASQVRRASAMRWHPDMVRFALALHLASPAAYELARTSGMIKLPCQRTLFDYSHVYEAEVGINEYILEEVSDEIEKMKYSYQKYHVLSCDEMQICQNLVFKKSTGEMVGYAKLNDAAADIAAMEKYLQSGDSTVKPQLASKMLCFMIKGIASSVKEVVAAYSVCNLTTEFLYECSWDVITKCERAGIAIVAFVADGYSVNRSFMKKHKPSLKTKNGIIYATVNKAAPDRLLFFMSDVAHLLKTTRNCLYNSGLAKTAKRCLEKNGQKMTWQPIIDLYRKHKKEALRKAYKLTSENVFLNSYSQMKVKHAATVLSNTVAKSIEDEFGSNAVELVKFIRHANDWFDCLNGAFSTHGIKTRNPNLDPYRSVEDSRFVLLTNFLEYLTEWKEEAFGIESALNLESSIAEAEAAISENEDPDGTCADVQEEEQTVTPAKKKILSQETMDGIEYTTMAFIDVVKFLLKEGVQYVNPRVFSQDHIEQHFSKQRYRSGGSSNPNYGRFLRNNVNIHLQGQIGVGKRKGNTEDLSKGMVITGTPLVKRKKTR